MDPIALDKEIRLRYPVSYSAFKGNLYMWNVKTLDLGGAWRLSQAGTAETMPANVPGCVHLDLLAAGQIEDPFYRDRENELRWIGETDWTYSRSFTMPEAMLFEEVIRLRCEGLDTLATIRLNGKEIGRADNMYRTWEFDVKPALRPGENTLEIEFASPLSYIARRQAERTLFNVGDKRIQPEGRSWIRKEPCNFGWDWGPVCITCGIWRPIRLVAFSIARLADVHIRQFHETGQVRLNVCVEAEFARGPVPAKARARLSFEGQEVASGEARLDGATTVIALEVAQPKLWWPNGMGDQPLYDVTIELMDEGGHPLDAARRRIGLRRLELVRRKDAWGESFHFEANGVAFFAKGANWIPADVFAPRLTRAVYERLLRDAAAVHMNFIRVWGGGIYESDDFYDLCDELGLCVWQEFMFSCAAYPAHDEAFLDNIRHEAADNLKRIRHHPCIALYCGNNEIEHCHLVNDDGSGGRMTWVEYDRLFNELLPGLVAEHDPDRSYWPSSSHYPPDRRRPNEEDAGDAHLWQVWHGRQPFEWFRNSHHRFCSEFGFQSFPEPRTVHAYTEEEDRNITSYIMEHHQRSGPGNALILHYMLSWFRLPVGFENTLWLSQIQHGLAMKYAVEHWRLQQPRCMGALYWQINDCWPVASWASIDYFGRWKALHYMARRFFAPALIAGVEDAQTGQVSVHVASDLATPQDAVWRWRLTTTEGADVRKGEARLQLPAHASAEIARLDFSEEIKSLGARRLLLWLELEADGKRLSDNLITFVRPKHLSLPDPHLTAEVRRLRAGVFQCRLKAAKPALWAWAEVERTDARYSNNFICLPPRGCADIEIQTSAETTLPRLRRSLRIRSLVDTYREQAT